MKTPGDKPIEANHATTLLTVTAALEAGAGFSLLAMPSAVAQVLFGTTLDSPASITVARVAGAALLALGASCGLARYDAQSCAARGLTGAMVLYNFVAVLILGAAGTNSQRVGIALWPVVILHMAMTAWCVTSLLRRPAGVSSEGPKRNP